HRLRRILRPDHRPPLAPAAGRVAEVARRRRLAMMTRAGWLRLLLVAALVGGLEWACRAGLVDPVAVIPPTRMAQGAWNLLASGQYNRDMLLTLTNVAMACALAVVTGFAG